MNSYNILDLEPGPLLDEAILKALGAVRVLECPDCVPDHIRERWPEGGALMLQDAGGNSVFYGTPPSFCSSAELLIGAVKKLVAEKLGPHVPLGKPDLVGTPSVIVGPPR